MRQGVAYLVIPEYTAMTVHCRFIYSFKETNSEDLLLKHIASVSKIPVRQVSI